MNKRENIFIFIIVLISLIIGYLIPIPSPIEIKKEKIKIPSRNAPIIKENKINWEELEVIFLIDIENQCLNKEKINEEEQSENE